MEFSRKTIFTLANFLSILRILLVPVIAWLMTAEFAYALQWAIGVMIFALLTDFFDGYFARLLNQVSDLGKILDPLADKLFIIFFVIVLIYLRGFPVWLAILFIAKEVLISLAALFVIRNKDFVMQSTLIGKCTFVAQAAVVVCYFLDYSPLKLILTIVSLALIFITMLHYGWRLIDFMKVKKPTS